MPKPKKQIAALPVRWNKNGKLRVLLITSRETRRWVMPKGWPMDGKKPWRAAEIEALEEAGVEGTMSREPIGTYDYKKKLENGERTKCRVKLYPMHVTGTKKKWPERHQRTRKWFSVRGAARAVDEPELVAILEKVAGNPRKLKKISEFKLAS